MCAEPLNTAEVVKACLDASSEAAWEDFVRCFQPVIAAGVIRVVRRYGRPDPDRIDDLIQETYLKLCNDRCKILRDFIPQGENSIFSYIKVVAINVSLDRYRAEGAQKRGRLLMQEDDLTEASTPSQSVEKQVLLNEMARHLDAKVESVRDRDIFWLYYRQGFNAREIADLPQIGLSAKGVESCIHRLTTLLRTALGPGTVVEIGGQK